jgi:hypothetical protein
MFGPFIWIKPERAKLRAFTSTPRLAEFLPVTKLSRALPDWWKDLPSTFEPPKPPPPPPGSNKALPPRPKTMLSSKHCYAMQETFKSGIGIPLWADHTLSVNPDGRVHATSPGNGKAGSQHPGQQFTGMLAPSALHYKFNSPWWLVCEKPVHFWMCHPFYHQRDPFRYHAMSGSVEYRNQHSTNVNVILRKPQAPVDIEFTAGEMICYLMPMTDMRIDLEVEEVSPAEIERINYTRFITTRPLLFNRKWNKAKTAAKANA